MRPACATILLLSAILVLALPCDVAMAGGGGGGGGGGGCSISLSLSSTTVRVSDVPGNDVQLTVTVQGATVGTVQLAASSADGGAVVLLDTDDISTVSGYDVTTSTTTKTLWVHASTAGHVTITAYLYVFGVPLAVGSIPITVLPMLPTISLQPAALTIPKGGKRIVYITASQPSGAPAAHLTLSAAVTPNPNGNAQVVDWSTYYGNRTNTQGQTDLVLRGTTNGGATLTVTDNASGATGTAAITVKDPTITVEQNLTVAVNQQKTVKVAVTVDGEPASGVALTGAITPNPDGNGAVVSNDTTDAYGIAYILIKGSTKGVIKLTMTATVSGKTGDANITVTGP